MDSQASSPNENQRRALIASRLVDVSFGSMWWVREWLWKIAIPRSLPYDRNSGRPEHPAVSILIGPPATQPQVPVMHGSSNGTQYSVWISGFSADDPSQYTAFGHLIRPGLVPQVWIGHFPVGESAFRHEWVRMFGPESTPPKLAPTPIRRVASNKRKATEDECRHLREFLRERGLL